MHDFNPTRPTTRRGALIRGVLGLRRRMAVAVIAVAFLGVLSGVDLGPLTAFAKADAAMHPVTALALVALGLWGLRMRRFGASFAGGAVLLGGVAGVCAARVMAGIVGLWTSVGPLPMFAPGAGYAGQVTAATALALGALSLAALLRRDQPRLGTGALVVGVAAVWVAGVRTAYGAVPQGADPGGLTLLGLTCAAMLMVSLYATRPLVRVLFLSGDLGSQVRLMTAVAVVLPFALGAALALCAPHAAPLIAAFSATATLGLLVVQLASAARLESTAGLRRRTEQARAARLRTDPLTQAMTRFGMLETLDAAWIDHCSSGATYGLVLLDLDHFTRIDETFGHHAADDVLSRVAATLRPHLRDSDTLGRWGGSEFLILLRLQRAEDLARVTDRLGAALAAEDSAFAAGLATTPALMAVSFGASVLAQGDHGPGDAITRADVDLNMARARRVPYAPRPQPLAARVAA